MTWYLDSCPYNGWVSMPGHQKLWHYNRKPARCYLPRCVIWGLQSSLIVPAASLCGSSSANDAVAISMITSCHLAAQPVWTLDKHGHIILPTCWTNRVTPETASIACYIFYGQKKHHRIRAFLVSWHSWLSYYTIFDFYCVSTCRQFVLFCYLGNQLRCYVILPALLPYN